MALPRGRRFLCLLVFVVIMTSVYPYISPVVALEPIGSGHVAEQGGSVAVQREGYPVEGVIRLDAVRGRAAGVKIILNGGERVTFPRANGYFSFVGVPAGTHLLEVVALGALFPPVRIDVSARLKGQVRAVYAEDQRQTLGDPMVLISARKEEYFEIREPFSVWSLLKSPMGMMVGFMLVVMVILPRLMDGIDPEEMKKMQEEMRNQPAPSLAGLLGGGGK